MEDERLEFMRKLLALCKDHRVDLTVFDGDGTLVAYREEDDPWIDDLAFVFSGERGGGPVEMKLKGYWNNESHEVT